MADDEPRPFLARWSQRKAQARSGVMAAEPVAPVAPVVVPTESERELIPSSAPEGKGIEPSPQPAPPTMEDVAALTGASDYSRFVAPGVDAGVRNAAMKKLFTDPHFNVMDRLDIYIDDYSQPDPIPESMLRQMVQSKFLGLFNHEEDAEKDKAAPVPAAGAADISTIAAADNLPHDDHTDLQLQPDHAAGRPGPDEGAGPGKV